MNSQEEEGKAPDWVLALVGITIVAVIVYNFKVMELLSIFMTFVVLPAVLILSAVVGSMGTYRMFSRNWNATVEAVSAKVQEKVAKAA